MSDVAGPRRIGHVINSIGLGGVPEAAWHLLAGLDARRYRRHLFVFSQAESEAEARAERLRRFTEAGVAVELAPAGAGLLARQAALADWLRRQRIELLHSHSYKPNLQARPVAAALRPAPRIVAHYHNQYDNKWDADASLPLDAALASGSDALLACSGAVAEHLQQRLGLAPGRVELLPNGVDTTGFRRLGRAEARQRLGLLDSPADLDRPVVGLVGRLCRQKGQDLFIDAVSRLAAARADTRWVLVGAADDAAVHSALQARAAAAGLAEPVLRWLGHRSDMPAVYSALDLLVAPSRWEGFGLMLVEAMACGTPVLGARAGAIPEVLGEAGRLVPAEDVPALAEAIAALLDDPAELTRLAAAGPRRAAAYSWSTSVRRLEAIYEHLLAAPGVDR
jgi:glycosyltransferase involved in cell wall biosynthesis